LYTYVYERGKRRVETQKQGEAKERKNKQAGKTKLRAQALKM
jgi:hypothetical protein